MITVFKFFFLLSPIVTYKIHGSSMAPTLASGQTVLVNRLSFLFFTPKIGDIIAFHDPRDGKILIKRITKKSRTKYMVEGDNKNFSTDSRVFGMIEKSAIVGKVWLS